MPVFVLSTKQVSSFYLNQWWLHQLFGHYPLFYKDNWGMQLAKHLRGFNMLIQIVSTENVWWQNLLIRHQIPSVDYGLNVLMATGVMGYPVPKKILHLSLIFICCWRQMCWNYHICSVIVVDIDLKMGQHNDEWNALNCKEVVQRGDFIRVVRYNTIPRINGW